MSEQKKGKRHRQVTNLDERLNSAVETVEKTTGVTMAEILRQGAIRVINEFRESGQLVFRQLKEAEKMNTTRRA